MELVSLKLQNAKYIWKSKKEEVPWTDKWEPLTSSHLPLQSFDDGDSRLDSTEFLKFVEQNETAINITTYMDQETNKLLRWAVDRMPEGGQMW